MALVGGDGSPFLSLPEAEESSDRQPPAELSVLNPVPRKNITQIIKDKKKQTQLTLQW